MKNGKVEGVGREVGGSQLTVSATHSLKEMDLTFPLGVLTSNHRNTLSEILLKPKSLGVTVPGRCLNFWHGYLTSKSSLVLPILENSFWSQPCG